MSCTAKSCMRLPQNISAGAGRLKLDRALPLRFFLSSVTTENFVKFFRLLKTVTQKPEVF